MRRKFLITFAAILIGAVAAISTLVLAQSRHEPSDSVATEQWEYLIVAGGTVNLNPTDSSTLRKAPGAFSRENFPLQQNMDKLGAKGWELVSVSGAPADPVFYFKRKK
ncbi:MAG TPA: hypothetical protein VFB82_24855 [Blastocatellia bacterium]|jgi:hypothetical protein|nr:hypothetical protein [Blastocatellia bacterium]